MKDCMKEEFVEPKIIQLPKPLTEEQIIKLKNNPYFKHNNQVNTMTKINLNDVAKKVAMMEAGKREVDITQIKEVMKDLCCTMGMYPDSMILDVIYRYRKKYDLTTGDPRQRTFVDKVKDAVGL